MTLLLPTDSALLHTFTATRHPDPFRQLVDRHLPAVHAAATRLLRRTRPPLTQHADDIAQSVFLLLAQNATKIPADTPLVAWLYKVTHYACSNLERIEQRRSKHEQEAAAMHPAATAPPTLSDAEALLDPALLSLSEPDRTALLLRYTQNLSVEEIATLTEVPPETAKKRLHRALTKLRKYFATKGMLSAAPIALHALTPAPAHAALAATITTTALTPLTAAAAKTTSYLIAKGVTHMLNLAKFVKAAAIIIVLGTSLLSSVLIMKAAAPPLRVATSPPSLQDITKIVQSHLGQIKDLQYQFDCDIKPKAAAERLDTRQVTVAWQQQNGWEKRTAVISEGGENPLRGTVQQAWNGIRSQRSDQFGAARTGAEGALQEEFDQLDPLVLLEVRGHGKDNQPFSLADWLKSKDVAVEGEDTIAGHSVVVVSVNETSSLKRDEGLVMKFWLDVSKGGMPLRTEMVVKGSLRRRIDATLSEISHGVYLPTECTVETFGVGKEGTNDEWSKGETTRFKIVPSSVKLNQGLTQEMFSVDFERGTPIANKDLNLVRYAGAEINGSDTKEATQDITDARREPSAPSSETSQTEIPAQLASGKIPGVVSNVSQAERSLTIAAVVIGILAIASTLVMLKRRWDLRSASPKQ